MFRGKIYPILIGLLLVGFAAWTQLTHVVLVRQIMDRLDALAYDLRLKASVGPKKVDPRIVIVDIDEKSLRAEGHFPWPRDKLAHLVDGLFQHGVAVIGFDIMFPEVDRNSAQEVIARMPHIQDDGAAAAGYLRRNARVFDNDLLFAKSLSQGDTVLGYTFHNRDDPPVNELPAALVVDKPEVIPKSTLMTMRSYTASIPLLQHNARSGGFFSVYPDLDGVIRRAPLLVNYHGKPYPSLALEVARLFFFADKVSLETAPVLDKLSVERVVLGNVPIPTDSQGRVIVPYRGGSGSFPYVSATDVLHGTVQDNVLEGAIVLVGITAQGLFDLRATPLQAVYPGVEVHANIIAGILDGRFPSEPSWSQGANFVLLVGVGLILAVVLPYLAPIALVVTTTLVGMSLVGFNFWMWISKGLILSLAPQLALLVLLAILNMAWGFLVEARGKRQLKGMFGQYVPAPLVEEMSKNPDKYGFEGESRELTVLFSDIRSFTTISEGLSANDLKDLLNRFFTPMTRVIFEHRGTIDKYVGDMVMAFWGAPVADERHALHAVQAAIEMQVQAAKLRENFLKEGLPEVRIGVGVNTGLMNVGDMGSEYRRSYTVLGDAVNLGSRLEGTSKYYGVGIVVGEDTYEQSRDIILYRELDLVRVKGKAKAIHVYEPVGVIETLGPETSAAVERFHQALALYRSRQWDGAQDVLEQLREGDPQRHVYALYLERIAELRDADLGEDWDGVYVRTTK